MIDFVRYRKFFYIITGVLLVVTIAALVAPPRLPWGLEFTSGSSMDFQFASEPEGATVQNVKEKIVALGPEYRGSVVQAVGERGYFIRIPRIEADLAPVVKQKLNDPNATITTLDGNNDLAMVVSFNEPVPESVVRGALGGDAAGLKVSKVGQAQYLVSVRGKSEADLQTTIKSLEKTYGPIETQTFQGADNMATMLDFGPAVPPDEFANKLTDLEKTLASTKVAQNGYLVVGSNVPRSAKDSLVSTMEGAFGRSKTTVFDQAGDMAMVLTFASAPDIGALRNELVNQQAFTAQAVPIGEKQILVVAKDLKTDLQDKIFTALKTKFGDVQRSSFNFATGVAEVLDFGPTPNEVQVRQFVTQVNPNAVVVAVDNHTFFVGGQAIAEDKRGAIVTALENSFGLAKQSPVDFTKFAPIQIRFADPVQLTDVQKSLAIIPVMDAVGNRATVYAVAPGTFLLVGPGLADDGQQAVISDIEGAVGTIQKAAFDAPDVLHIALDFGPATSLLDVREEAAKADPNVALESIDNNKYLLVASDMPLDRQPAILSALEQKYGPAKRVLFNRPEDMILIVKFAKDTDIGAVRSAVSNAGLTGATVAQDKNGTYDIVANNISADRREDFFVNLKIQSGDFTHRYLDLAKGMAVGMDFGDTPDLATLRAAIKDAGFSNVYAQSAGQSGFFVGGHGISQAKQGELLKAIENKFGPATRRPFPTANDLAAIVTVVDVEKASRVVSQTVIAQKFGPNEFFLGAANIPVARREQVFSALQGGFGTMQQTPFDFATGVAATVNFTNPVEPEQVKNALEPAGYLNMSVESRNAGKTSYFIRSDRPEAGQRNLIVNTMEKAYTTKVDPASVEFSFVDAEIAQRSVLNTLLAVAASSVGILLYVWYAFRKAPKAFRYGVATLIALLHDVLIVIGAFAILSKFHHVEIDSLMIIGILAVIGFSVNNTIVVIDRIRENLGRFPNRSFGETVNISLNETLSRNLNTTVTTTLAIMAVLFFGGPTIFNFMLVLLIGIVAGLYSSLFLAAPFLVSWDRGELSVRRKSSASPAGGPAIAHS